MTIGVIPNLDKRGSSDMVEKIGTLFLNEGIDAYLPDSLCCSVYKSAPEEEIFKNCDIIVTIGGDGTIIRYAKRAAAYGKPILGINAGRMGYLANVEQNDYKLLSKLKTGDYSVEERMLLKVDLSDNEKTFGVYEALNDAVITGGFISRIIDVKAYIGRENIHYRADGLIVSTPTGSTAYSMSAGGPIIDPVMDAICLTPICSHTLTAKPMIISADKSLVLKAYSKKRVEIFLSIDGRKAATLKPYNKITVTKSERTVKLITLNDRSFFSTLSAKFSDVRGVNNER